MFDNAGNQVNPGIPAHVVGGIWTAAFNGLTSSSAPYALVVYDNGVEAARSINLSVTS
jgi:hypothetical protein